MERAIGSNRVEAVSPQKDFLGWIWKEDNVMDYRKDCD